MVDGHATPGRLPRWVSRALGPRGQFPRPQLPGAGTDWVVGTCEGTWAPPAPDEPEAGPPGTPIISNWSNGSTVGSLSASASVSLNGVSSGNDSPACWRARTYRLMISPVSFLQRSSSRKVGCSLSATFQAWSPSRYREAALGKSPVLYALVPW